VSECDREASAMRKPWLNGGAVLPWKALNESVLEIVFMRDTTQLDTEYHFLLLCV